MPFRLGLATTKGQTYFAVQTGTGISAVSEQEYLLSVRRIIGILRTPVCWSTRSGVPGGRWYQRSYPSRSGQGYWCLPLPVGI